MENKIKELLSQMTIEEKISFCSGHDAWHAESLRRLGIPEIMMCDGPHGLRKRDKNEQGEYYTVKATCFPPASAMANSWDPSLAGRVGKYIGEECKAEQVSILLGPGMNIKRSPTCGRNFEYYSEDPYLSGKVAAGFINGLQGEGIAACAKHFCVNNQETRRFSTSANVSERALYEIYLPSFEIAVKEANVQTIMHSYNRINGHYVSEDKELITDTLRGKWGFNGYVMSDWNAMSSRVPAYKAGTDVEMPPCSGLRDAEVLEAYKNGEITMEEIDNSVTNVLRVIFRHLPNGEKGTFSVDEHHSAAAKAAEECMVLLKNDNNVLPFESGKPLAVIGGFAKKPRFQGGGSSHVEPLRVDDITEYLNAENGIEITYADGYDEKHTTNPELIAEAVEAAKKCGRAVIFAGMPDSYETEGRDRRHMKLPPAHNELIEAVCTACENVVVVLMAGSPNELPWVDKAPAIMHAYLGGQALGGAVARILFGKVNPSGKLAETHPVRFEDNPAYLNFPGDGDECFYGEDIYVGYRYYDKKKMDVLFPFGHGLSYTRFEYTSINADGNTVTVTVKNIGARVGKEVVQLYASALPHPVTSTYVGESSFGFARPEKWLVGFDKIELAPGEEKEVAFELYDRVFSVYDAKVKDFRVIGGDYAISAAASSRDIRISTTVSVEDDTSFVPVITKNTVFEDLFVDKRYPKAIVDELVKEVLPQFEGDGEEGLNFDEMRRHNGYVLRQKLTTVKSIEKLDEIIERANKKLREYYGK
ncbi:MAG: glycoside hydrolase family 3 C-terminal domain-containing protein [Clostridia bacterium]|nr:glycoside hydrolase family 3 C-terminal domain-containing protein [Clostridia bacterium]